MSISLCGQANLFICLYYFTSRVRPHFKGKIIMTGFICFQTHAKFLTQYFESTLSLGQMGSS